MIDPHLFRSVLGRFATGVTVLTTRMGAEDHGMTASAFCSVSLSPPLVLACIDEKADMIEFLRSAEHLGVNVLSEEQEALSRRFAEIEGDRFEGVGFKRGVTGVALLDNALAHLECRIVDRHPAGDHTIYVAEVLEAEAFGSRPLIYYRSGYAMLER
jgi:flavin reductase (DIM6/NTAB) family NADH-FMN oxidoreductase RutF